MWKAHVPHSTHHDVCVPCQFSKVYAMRRHCIFLLQNIHIFTSKYAFISIMLVKMIPLFFFLVIHWVPTWSWTLSSLTFNWPTLPLIFFFPYALTTGSRFVSQREALYQEERSFLTWMNSLSWKPFSNISCSYSTNLFCYRGFLHGIPKTAHSLPDFREDNQSREAQKSQLRDMNMSLFLWEKLLP